MAKKRISSRLAKKQKQQLTKQSLVLLALSIIIGGIFLIVVLPNAVRLFFEVLDKQTIIEQDSGLPPQTPLIESPPSYTNEAKLKLSGYASANSTVHLLLNSQKETSVEAGEEGMFEVEVALSDGENLISLYSTNEADLESQTVSYQVNLDTKEPEIKIGSPEPDQKFELKDNQTIQVVGETEPRAKVFIDSRMVVADADGLFSQRYHLSEGENKIEIRVIDQAGNEAETELTVFFRE
jgi:bacillopeptidase F